MDDYDEFGNYIGPLSESEDEQEALGVEHAEPPPEPPAEDASGAQEEGAVIMHVDEPASQAVVLHEDKVYYPSASEVYGDDVETLVQEEDAQPLTQPIVER